MNLKLIHEIVVFSEEVNRRKEFEASQTDKNESGLYFTVQPYVTLVGYLWIDSAVSTNHWRKTFVNDKVKKKRSFYVNFIVNVSNCISEENEANSHTIPAFTLIFS